MQSSPPPHPPPSDTHTSHSRDADDVAEGADGTGSGDPCTIGVSPPSPDAPRTAAQSVVQPVLAASTGVHNAMVRDSVEVKMALIAARRRATLLTEIGQGPGRGGGNGSEGTDVERVDQWSRGLAAKVVSQLCITSLLNNFTRCAYIPASVRAELNNNY